MMRIRKLSTQNYKNLYAEEVFSFKDLNIFIGPNGSGKSNVISVLKFLKDAITPVDQIRGITSFEDAISNLGGANILSATISRPAEVRFAFEFTPDKGTDHQILDLQFFIQDAHKKVIINEESLHNSNTPPFYFYRCHNQKSGEGVVSAYSDNESRRTHFKPLPNAPVDELTLLKMPQLLENTEFPPEKMPIYKVRRDFMESISKWLFYNANNMNLSGIRTAEPKLGLSDKIISPSGENLSLVLYNLVTGSLDFEERIDNAMKSILPMTRRIRAIPSGRLSLTIEWHMDNIRDPFYLSEMSDGSVRMLCWAVILHSPILPPLLVIDEPEVGIHVAWFQTLSEWIKDASRRTQVIICTHSPDLLDYFTDCIENVHVFEPQKENKILSSIKMLSQQKIHAWIEEGWKLGDLYRVGDPSVGGWPW